MGSGLNNLNFYLGCIGVEKNVIPAKAGIQDYSLSGFLLLQE